MKKNEIGFSVIELLIVVIVMVAVCLAGWYVWKMQDTTDRDASQTTPNNQSTGSGANLTADYLTIKEWGVKLKLSSDIKDATYTFAKPPDTWVHLSTPKLAQLAQANPGCSEATQSITINRAKPGDQGIGAPWTEAELMQAGVKIGDYYYFGARGDACFEGHKALPEPEAMAQIRTSLADAIKNVRKL